MSYQITVNERTMRKLADVGKILGITDGGDCVEACIDAKIDQINVSLAESANAEFNTQSDECMLHPSGFEGANAVFGPPTDKTEEEVYSLIAARVVWGEDPGVLSCWKPTEAQIERIRTTGRLWVTLFAPVMVPICITTEKPTVFPNVKFAE